MADEETDAKGDGGKDPERPRLEGREVGLQAVVEMLLREMEASKSVSDHLSFLRGLASGEAVSPALREHLVQHIAEEESEHQAHLARLVPTLQALSDRFGGPIVPAPAPELSAPPAPGPAKAESPLPGLTVGSLIAKRPWFTRL